MGRLWLSVPFLILVAVLGFACGGESNNGDVEKTPIVIYASTPTPIPVTSSDNEFTALRNKVPEPCVGTNMIDVFSATGYMISFDWDTDQYLDAVGVGFVFNGYILTAEHVIDDILENGLSTIWLHVPSEEATSSTMPVGVNVVYSDPENDFALLELDEKSDIKYEDIREVMDEFEIRPLDSEIPNRFLCFFRALYPTWLRAPDVAALPGEYPAAYEWFDLEEGRNFTFDSVVGGQGASGSPVLVKTQDGRLVVAGLISQGKQLVKEDNTTKIQTRYMNFRVVDIGFICQELKENAGIDLCDFSE